MVPKNSFFEIYQVRLGGWEMSDRDNNDVLLNLICEVVTAYVSNNSVPTDQVSELIRSVHQALISVETKSPEPLEPAVSVKRSVTPDYIVCLEDGKKLRTLKRHLKTAFNLSPQEYRRKWGLPDDYPMVAPAYSTQRKELAKKIGLGKGHRRRRGGSGKMAS